ncbi:Protein CBG28038 [Caenorhabditis briggsae]|uniref:Transmembrane protein n=2 Tax=Caenorhabditis briggsae TaxID=6238 RepID=A0AAE9CXD0_CAEBR|nr:Protein CBG28038 [Caenorhabditis briggsae]ULT84356.1 hypothetical protein L3Y34_013199 [Caenorhabditis briggsae]CAR99058.1 Protein CBG28038 [Caenorhabditis briggsae]
MARSATVAPEICIIEPTITSTTGVEEPIKKPKKPRSPCVQRLIFIARTIFFILALTSGGLALSYWCEKGAFSKKSKR